MYCRKCKKKVESDSLHCPDCGKRLYKSNHSLAIFSIVVAILFVIFIVVLFTKVRLDAIAFVR